MINMSYAVWYISNFNFILFFDGHWCMLVLPLMSVGTRFSVKMYSIYVWQCWTYSKWFFSVSNIFHKRKISYLWKYFSNTNEKWKKSPSVHLKNFWLTNFLYCWGCIWVFYKNSNDYEMLSNYIKLRKLLRCFI